MFSPSLFELYSNNDVYAADDNPSHTPDEGNDDPTTLPSATITVSGGSGNDAVDAALGQMTYTSRTVDVDVNGVYNYHLYISGDSTLVPDNDRGVTFTGVNGATPSNGEFGDYKWGYAWGETAAMDDNMTYYTPTSALIPLEVPNLINDGIKFTKKITFAAKFPVTAVSGNYRTENGIKLSLITTPKTTASIWKDSDGNPTGAISNTDYMQNISAGFCKDNDAVRTGDTIVLYDTRDSLPYTIVKLKDGNCWMQENLKLTPPSEGEGKLLTRNDTDLAEDTQEWLLPNSWTTDNNVAAMLVGNTDLNARYKPEYGNYYNWCAATAGSCTQAMKANDVASSSICAKSWHLPSSGIVGENLVGEYPDLFGKDGSLIGSTTLEAVQVIQEPPYNFLLAGRATSADSLEDVGGYGKYWSKVSLNNVGAYLLGFAGSYFSPSSSDTRGMGISIRCVANY